MQLKAINTLIEAFVPHLQGAGGERFRHLYAAQQHFGLTWDLEAASLSDMYEKSLVNPKTNRVWKRDGWEPKRMMGAFCEADADFTKQLFQDLLNESKQEEARMLRFHMFCDQLLSEYKQKNPLTIDNNHYHGDFWMISLYLAFAYPEKYTLYDRTAFVETLRALKAQQLPVGDDMGRFLKVSRTLGTFLSKSVDLKTVQAERFADDATTQGSQLLIFEFMVFVAEKHSNWQSPL